MSIHHADSTICALSTANGVGAIALIRVSGKDAISICNSIFSRDISNAEAHKAYFGVIHEFEENIDEVVLTVFRAPHSFTGEDVVEIACHGSRYIQQRILQLLLSLGCTSARAGEFTQRAFMNGKMDLSQAEGVADLIASESAAAHRLALQQVRGGFSKEINRLRDELIHFASMIELELDFSGEDVEFADRSQLKILILRIQSIIKRLIDSFAYGNVLKNGIPVAIVGIPNVGKSTLLNALLNEDKAIVSEIPGTTRDAIEDEIVINGVEFRFIDTAGLRETKDIVEGIGIEKTYKKIEEAQIVLYLVESPVLNSHSDSHTHSHSHSGSGSHTHSQKLTERSQSATILNDQLKHQLQTIQKFQQDLKSRNKQLIVVVNKCEDKSQEQLQVLYADVNDKVFISAKEKQNLEELKKRLFEFVSHNDFYQQDVVVTNSRHHAALEKAYSSLQEVEKGVANNIPGDLLAIDIRKGLMHLSEITGDISSDDLLGSIFSKFCIGK